MLLGPVECVLAKLSMRPHETKKHYSKEKHPTFRQIPGRPQAAPSKELQYRGVATARAQDGDLGWGNQGHLTSGTIESNETPKYLCK